MSSLFDSRADDTLPSIMPEMCPHPPTWPVGLRQPIMSLSLYKRRPSTSYSQTRIAYNLHSLPFLLPYTLTNAFRTPH